MEHENTTYPPDYVMEEYNAAERDREYDAARPRAYVYLYMPGYTDAPCVAEPEAHEPMSTRRGVCVMRM